MASEFLFGLNQVIVLIISLVILYASIEVGYRYGTRFADRTSEHVHAHVATVEAALLGLMALLLGFAFSMAMSRFDDRKQIVMNEANDLQTTFMRSQLLPAAHRDVCARLLREYLDSRIAYYQAGTDKARINQSLQQTRKIQSLLWKQAVLASRENDSEVVTGYFISSLNALIDDHTKRLTAMENHVPQTIIILLVMVSCMTMAVTGYSSGLRTKRLKALRRILIILVAATLNVIVDLDRPRRGFIQVSEAGMVQLKADLDNFQVNSEK